MSLVTCKECGAQISDKSTKCIHCGAPTTYSLNVDQDKQINEAERSDRLVQNEEEIDAGNEVSDKNGKKKTKIIMIAILSILILATIAAAFLLHGNSKAEALSNKEIFAVGSVRELMAQSSDSDGIELKKIEVAKNNDDKGFGDYIVRITYNADNDNIGLSNQKTGELYAFVGVTIGDGIKYTINKENQALLAMAFGLLTTNEGPVDVDINLVNKVLANPSKYDLNINLNSGLNDNGIVKMNEATSDEVYDNNNRDLDLNSIRANSLAIDYMNKTYDEIKEIFGNNHDDVWYNEYSDRNIISYGDINSIHISFGFPSTENEDIDGDSRVNMIEVTGNWKINNQISIGMTQEQIEEIENLDFEIDGDEGGTWIMAKLRDGIRVDLELDSSNVVYDATIYRGTF